MRRWVIAGCSLLAIVALVIGITQTNGSDSSETPQILSAQTAAQQLRGAPQPFAAIHAQSNELLFGGKKAYDKRIGALKGKPIVVNVWASWCDPCREETPIFNRVSVALGKQVAFLGVNFTDADDRARRFMRRFPVSYPSYSDGKGRIGGSLGVGALPGTVFINRSGQPLLHQGRYHSVADLEADIRKYAMTR